MWSVQKIVLLYIMLGAYHCKKKDESTVLVHIDTKEEVGIGIYYGAENAESVAWFQKFFKNDYKTFEGFLEFRYFPCRDITVCSVKKTISCPDPDKTCYLNKIHACANQHFKDKAKLNDFIMCSIENPKDALTKCAAGDQCMMQTLDKCAKGDEGVKLCIGAFNLLPPFKKMPLFIIDAILELPTGMVDANCKSLKLHDKKYPTVCGKCQ